MKLVEVEGVEEWEIERILNKRKVRQEKKEKKKKIKERKKDGSKKSSKSMGDLGWGRRSSKFRKGSKEASTRKVS